MQIDILQEKESFWREKLTRNREPNILWTLVTVFDSGCSKGWAWFSISYIQSTYQWFVLSAITKVSTSNTDPLPHIPPNLNRTYTAAKLMKKFLKIIHQQHLCLVYNSQHFHRCTSSALYLWITRRLQQHN